MPKYNKQSLIDGIQKCKDNILIFENAIDNERKTIKDYQQMIDIMDEQERKEKEIAKNIHIEIDKE